MSCLYTIVDIHVFLAAYSTNIKTNEPTKTPMNSYIVFSGVRDKDTENLLIKDILLTMLKKRCTM